MKLLILIIYILILGVAKSQVSFFVSPDLNIKMSISSKQAGYFDSKNANFSNLFNLDNKSFKLNDPFRLGFTIGSEFKNHNQLLLSLHYDGVSIVERIYYQSFNPLTGIIGSGSTLSKSRSAQSRFSISYFFNMQKTKNKTTLAFAPVVGLAWRAGPLGIAPVGGMGGERLLPNNKVLAYSSVNYTAYGKYAFIYGLGVKSNLYFKDKYLLSLSMKYTYSRGYLGFNKMSINILDNNNGQIDKYEFYSYFKATGLYLTISRELQILPWKKRKNKGDKIKD
jgi:hypothetical protein